MHMALNGAPFSTRVPDDIDDMFEVESMLATILAVKLKTLPLFALLIYQNHWH